MDRIIPNIDWARKVSIDLGIPTRCQFATIEKCPRYYQSLSLLKEIGRTGLDPKKDKKLQKKWEKSPLWPQHKEQFTSITGNSGEQKNLSNYCPEVTFDQFGYFGSSILPFKDELDHENSIRFAIKEELPNDHWQYHYSHVTKMHYSDCPLYSPLKNEEDIKKLSIPLLDQIIKKVRNNPIIAIIIIISIIIIGLGSFTDALTKIQKWFDSKISTEQKQN